MTHPDPSPTGGSDRDGVNLRLLWPPWQGAGTSSVEAFASEFPLDVARRGYAVGTPGSRSRPKSYPPRPEASSRTRDDGFAWFPARRVDTKPVGRLLAGAGISGLHLHTPGEDAAVLAVDGTLARGYA